MDQIETETSRMNSRQPQAMRLAITDDHPIVRDGLRRLLEEISNYRVIGEASDGAETIKLTRQLKPDILLLDLKMPEDQECLEALRELSTSGRREESDHADGSD